MFTSNSVTVQLRIQIYISSCDPLKEIQTLDWKTLNDV